MLVKLNEGAYLSICSIYVIGVAAMNVEFLLQLLYVQYCDAFLLLRNPTEAIATYLEHIIISFLDHDLADICAEIERGNIIFSFNLEDIGVFNRFMPRDPSDTA